MNENVRFGVGLAAIVFMDWTDSNQTRHRWTASELNVIMAVLSKMKDKSSSDEVEIAMTYLLELSTGCRKGAQHGKTNLAHIINSISERQQSIMLLQGKDYIKLPLFERLEITDDREDFNLHVRLNTDVEKFFSNSKSKYIRFRLSEYISLNSVYSKLLYIHLKQFRTQGRWSVNFDIFKAFMGKPDATAGYVNRKILPIAMNECSKYFKSLTYQYERKGNKIVRVVFEFTSEVDTDNELRRYYASEIEYDSYSTPKDSNNIDYSDDGYLYGEVAEEDMPDFLRN